MGKASQTETRVNRTLANGVTLTTKDGSLSPKDGWERAGWTRPGARPGHPGRGESFGRPVFRRASGTLVLLKPTDSTA